MTELTNEEKLKILEKLPVELQDIYFEDSGAILLYLSKKYGLSDDKISLLAKIIGNIILGILPLQNLAPEITSKIAVEQNLASQITQEINNELFAPVANLLKGASTPIATPQVSKSTTDRYREPLVVSRVEPTAGPEVIDLRKTPPPPMPAPVAAAPIPPVASRVEPLVVSRVEPPKPAPMMEIEAEPHKVVDLRQDKGEF